MSIPAVYQDESLPKEMKGNPLIEALDPLTQAQKIIEDMLFLPSIDHDCIRSLSIESRLLHMASLERLYLPPEIANDFASDVDVLIRQSYARRNPMLPEVTADLYRTKDLAKSLTGTYPTHSGMILLVGKSGMGKTRLVRSTLNRLKQCITHTSYKDRPFNSTQVVWLSVESPVNGSQRGLMFQLLSALDNAVGIKEPCRSYEKAHQKTPVDRLIQVFAQAAASHHLGIIHIDDLQLVSGSSRAKTDIAHFVIQIASIIKCPVVFSVTPDLGKVLGEEFQVMRRVCSAGSHSLESSDKFSEMFLRTLFRYQWTDSIAEGTSMLFKKISKLSKDITSVTLLMHLEAQKLALRNGASIVSFEHYEKVYREKVKPLHSALRGM